MELFLTPEQIYQLEESARLAFGRPSRQRSAQPPRLKVISSPQPEIEALQAVAPTVTTAETVSEDEFWYALPVTKANDATPRDEQDTTSDTPSGLPSSSELSISSCLPEPAATHAAARPHRRAPISTFKRSFFWLVIALLVPAIVVAAMIKVAAFHRPITSLPASAIERAPVPAEPPAQTSKPAAGAKEPAIADLPVKFANPFDRSEIFEFPPGTTRQEAREAVAQILIERAGKRRNGVRVARR
jgi:hypothetical protein